MKSRTRNHALRSTGVRVFGLPLFALAILPGIAAAISTNSVHAQQAPDVQKLKCAAHDKMTKLLGTKFTEAPRSLGLAADGKVLEVFSTDNGGTWTMVVTAPEGTSCIVASGRYWQHVPAKPKGPDV